MRASTLKPTLHPNVDTLELTSPTRLESDWQRYSVQLPAGHHQNAMRDRRIPFAKTSFGFRYAH